MNGLKYWICLAALCGVMYASLLGWRSFQSALKEEGASDQKEQYYAEQKPAPTFQLIDQLDQPFNSTALLGHVWVGSVFFSSCPGTCWQLNTQLEKLQEATQGTDIFLVSVTCDPEMDKPEVLKKYAEHFHADSKRWFFLTGDPQEIQRVGEKVFKVELATKVHSNRAIVFDRSGKMQGSFLLTDDKETARLEKMVKKLEAEPIPESISTNDSPTRLDPSFAQ